MGLLGHCKELLHLQKQVVFEQWARKLMPEM